MKLAYVVELNAANEARPFTLRVADLMTSYAAFLQNEAQGGRVVSNTPLRLSSDEGDTIYQDVLT